MEGIGHASDRDQGRGVEIVRSLMTTEEGAIGTEDTDYIRRKVNIHSFYQKFMDFCFHLIGTRARAQTRQ